ncbi:hypothetical protein HDV00_008517 [Rhizophlyctis rosea]|nr:hypothetical protein HDV00_008517 [Rhizophlyctis rosea]
MLETDETSIFLKHRAKLLPLVVSPSGDPSITSTGLTPGAAGSNATNAGIKSFPAAIDLATTSPSASASIDSLAAPTNPSTASIKVQTPLPLRGIRLSYLQTLIQQWGGPRNLYKRTTADVCKHFLIPHIRSGRFSPPSTNVHKDPTLLVCDLLALQTPDVVGRAKWFISHSWQHMFLYMVDTLVAHFTPAETDIIIWIDLFSLPQTERKSMSAD